MSDLAFEKVMGNIAIKLGQAGFGDCCGRCKVNEDRKAKKGHVLPGSDSTCPFHKILCGIGRAREYKGNSERMPRGGAAVLAPGPDSFGKGPTGRRLLRPPAPFPPR